MTIAAYRLRTGQYPITVAQIRQISGVGFGEVPDDDVLDLANADPVEATPQAYDPATQRVVGEGAPVKEGGVWRQVWIVDDIPPPTEPEAPAAAPPSLYAAAQLVVADGEVSGIGVNSRLAGAFVLDVGSVYVMFLEAFEGDYMAMVSAVGPCSAFVDPANKFPDSFIVTIIDSAGNPADVGAINVSIIRA